jgi:hypothetical protein
MEDFPVWKHELPGFPHRVIDLPLKSVVDFYLTTLERGTRDGKLTPANLWIVCRGLLLGAIQSYVAVCLLLAEKRPKPLMLQAGILNRSIFETLVNIVALVEDPSRIRILDLEAFKSLALRYQDFSGRFGAEGKWAEYLAVYRKSVELAAKTLGLTLSEITDPTTIVADWPTPGRLIFGRPSQKIAPWVSGSRQDVLKKLYTMNYPHQSELSHQRIGAVSAALLVDKPEFQWNPGHGESNLVVTAAFLVASIVAELQAAGGYSRHPKLAELWAYLREMDDDVKELWEMRYESLVAPAS